MIWYCSKMVPNGPKQSENKQKWSQMIPNGPKWSQMVPNGPKWSDIFHNGQTWFNMVQYAPNCSKMSNSLKINCYQSWNVTITEMSPEFKYHKHWNVTKIEMLQTKISTKLECHKNWNVTEMSPKRMAPIALAL